MKRSRKARVIDSGKLGQHAGAAGLNVVNPEEQSDDERDLVLLGKVAPASGTRVSERNAAMYP